jgi:hypothetical protein
MSSGVTGMTNADVVSGQLHGHAKTSCRSTDTSIKTCVGQPEPYVKSCNRPTQHTHQDMREVSPTHSSGHTRGQPNASVESHKRPSNALVRTYKTLTQCTRRDIQEANPMYLSRAIKDHPMHSSGHTRH